MVRCKIIIKFARYILMIHFRNITAWLVVVMTTALFISCSNETDTKLTTQQNSIEKYLQNTHQPRLIPESKISESLDENPEYYTQWGLDIFRYITTMYVEGRDNQPIISKGDKIEIIYAAYIFSNNKPSINDLFATNDSALIEELKKEGLNTSYEWSDEPIEVKVGGDDILPSLSTALVDCHEGDTVEIYLTYKQAYGKHYLGSVPSYSPQLWVITINKII